MLIFLRSLFWLTTSKNQKHEPENPVIPFMFKTWTQALNVILYVLCCHNNSERQLSWFVPWKWSCPSHCFWSKLLKCISFWMWHVNQLMNIALLWLSIIAADQSCCFRLYSSYWCIQPCLYILSMFSLFPFYCFSLVWIITCKWK
jgi:hypothetical protein